MSSTTDARWLAPLAGVGLAATAAVYVGLGDMGSEPEP